MKIHLLRHGLTNDNLAGIQQDEHDELHDIGHHQATLLGQRLRSFQFDRLFCSPLKRALQTAKYIQSEINLSPTIIEELREIKRPSSIQGMNNNDPIVKNIKTNLFAHQSDPSYRYEDEETFTEFRERVKTALDKLIESGGANILAISHGVTIKLMICFAIFGPNFTPSDYMLTYDNFILDNASITSLIIKNGDLKLLTFNDHAHLWE